MCIVSLCRSNVAVISHEQSWQSRLLSELGTSLGSNILNQTLHFLLIQHKAYLLRSLCLANYPPSGGFWVLLTERNKRRLNKYRVASPTRKKYDNSHRRVYPEVSLSKLLS